MKAIGFIPARFNSSRFPGKLLAIAQGKTILQRTLESALNCSMLSSVYVATDDEKIAYHVESLGAQIIWTSPHCRNGTERLIEALSLEPKLRKSKIILNVQGDHPCTSPEAMEAVIKALQKDPLASMATAATHFKDLKTFLSPHAVKCVFDGRQKALYFSRSPIPYCRDGLPPNAYHHIGLYAYRTPFLLSFANALPTPLQLTEDLEQLQILEKGFSIKIALVQDPPIGIDTPEDLEHFEAFLALIPK